MTTPELASFKPEPEPKKEISYWPLVVGLGMFLLGLAMLVFGPSAAYTADGESVAAEPVPTVTATVNKTDVQEVTPQVCLDALDLADEGFDVASQAMFAAQGTVEALLESDLAGMEQSNAELAEAADRLGPLADRYNEAKGNCRTAAK